MIEGVIFDMDGVLVDNVRQHVQAWQQLGYELGRTLTDAEIRRVFGQRNREILEAQIGPSFSEEELSHQADRKEELYRSIMKRDMKPHTGLIEFLASLRREGIRMAVATSGPQDNASLILDGLNIRHFFGVVVTGADVSRSKPDPEIFLLAAGKMGVNPERCVVFEDSVAGIQAARSAGCLCIGVATTHTEEELEPLHPCQIISDFVGLRPADLGVFLQT